MSLCLLPPAVHGMNFVPISWICFNYIWQFEATVR